MCVLAFAWQAHPRWQLVVAANRDERHDRPAAPIERWRHHQHVVAGRDLLSGGTWLGISEAGRFAAVTNRRSDEPSEPGRPSRGALVIDALTGQGAYADPAVADLAVLSPFNLVAIDGGRARFATNRPDRAVRELSHGIYGVSNGPLDAPWAKTVELKARLARWMDRDLPPQQLLDWLHVDAEPLELGDLAALQSRIFIVNPRYGTRCSTVVLIDVAGRGLLLERRYTPDGEAAGDRKVAFEWPAGADRML